MTLEFDKVYHQIAQMGSTLAFRESAAAARLQAVWDRFMALTDNDAIWEKIMVARTHDAGFRGAAPGADLIPADCEPFTAAFALPDCPEQATILAADGSQIYPDPHASSLYYLTNIAVFVYHHGDDGALPEPVTEPQLFYQDEEVKDREGRIIANAAVNARRSIFEMQLLARETWQRNEAAHPLVSISDGPLLFWLGKEVPNGAELMDNYHEAMGILGDLDARLVGYVDQPRSRFVINTLYLMSLEDDAITRANLTTTGDMEGLDDRFIMRHLLRAGDRSAIMIQQSPQNKAFKDMGEEREIAFFYINLSSPYQDPYLARVEIPMWIARNPGAVDQVHALLYSQCQITDRYPYVLTRADECAVVRGHEKTALNEMIQVELLKNQLSVETSQKLAMKAVSRYGRQQHTGV